MSAFTITRRMRWAAAALAALLMTVLWAAWPWSNREWRSSPTQSRAHLQTGFGYDYPVWETWFTHPEFKPPLFVVSANAGMEPHLLPSWDVIRGKSLPSPYLQEAWKELIFTKPATGFPTIEGLPRDAKDREQGAKVPVQFHFADEAAQTWKGNGTGLQLAAIGVAYPDGSRNVLPVTFYDPRGMERKEMEDLIPAGLLSDSFQSETYTRLSLFFRIEGDPETYQAWGINATFYDGRTFAAIGWEQFPEVIETAQGHFLVVDAGLLLYHDTPLLVVLNVPEGPPQRQVIDPEKAPAVFTFQGPHPFQVRLLGALPGDQSASQTPVASTVEIKPGTLPDTAATLYWDFGDLCAADFLELEELNPDGTWVWAASLRAEQSRKDGTVQRFSYYPGLQHVCFRLAGMPMLPHRRDAVQDLLDLRPPWNQDTRPYYDEIATAAQLAYVSETSRSTSATSPGNRLSLRDWLKLMEKDQQHVVTIDSRKMELRVKDRPVPWTARFRDWLKEKTSGGDPFHTSPFSP